jgi:hypothetical protein
LCNAQEISRVGPGTFLGYADRTDAEGGLEMTFSKPLNLIAVGAAFVFIGAIVIGAF